MPLFSVLLPTHNRPDVLALAIRSVLAQSLQDFEVLVVGDGCTDETAEVVSGFGDPRIRWFDLPKAPSFGYANRNIALREARGKLVAFLGHDNLYFPDHLERMARAFRSSEVRLAYSLPLFLRDDGLVLPVFINLRIRPWRQRFLKQMNDIPATCVVHRREDLAAAGFWPEEAERDGDWILWKALIADRPPEAVLLERQPTCLHFRADWRQRLYRKPPLNYLASLYDQERFWPFQLHLHLDEGATPQQQVWEKLSADPDRFVGGIRAGVRTAADHLAFSAGLDPAFS
ncbi:glycosyltransferase family 2 protein [Pseudoroseicyclus sp. CXY001]|uniref:glycosyltransferase family 2 protein n=1 Tax=Pseudoroseicyclus sp. CXY001 TaxID=3242492 RepID=UPI003570A87B